MSLARSKWCRQIRLKKCAVHRIATPTTTVLNKARHSHGLYVRDVDGIIAEGSMAWAPHNSKGSKQNGAVTKRSTGRLSGGFVTEGRLEERVHTHTERGGTQWERGAACV